MDTRTPAPAWATVDRWVARPLADAAGMRVELVDVQTAGTPDDGPVVAVELVDVHGNTVGGDSRLTVRPDELRALATMLTTAADRLDTIGGAR